MKTQIAPNTNAYVVSVPPRSDGAELHAVINDLEGCFLEEVQLMAAGLDFATPREVCGLRAVLDYAAAHARTVRFECPIKPAVHDYLARLDFYVGLPKNVILSRQPRGTRRHDRTEKLIELIRIESPADVVSLMDRVSKVAQGEVGAGLLSNAFATAIGAAAENVFDHACSPNGALLAAQRYQTTGLELAVIDLGDGIPVTLRRNPEYEHLDDLRSLERALEDGVTSTGLDGRGAGLADFIKRVGRGGDATVGIASGHADLRISWTRGAERRQATKPRQPVPGTWIWLRLASIKGENR